MGGVQHRRASESSAPTGSVAAVSWPRARRIEGRKLLPMPVWGVQGRREIVGAQWRLLIGTQVASLEVGKGRCAGRFRAPGGRERRFPLVLVQRTGGQPLP